MCVCVCREGSGEPHCEMEKVTGNLPQYWSWVSLASYTGNFTFHEVVYDSWTASVSYCFFHVHSTLCDL